MSSPPFRCICWLSVWIACAAASLQAGEPPEFVPFVDVTAHNGYVNIDGRMEDMITQTGMTITNMSDPSTWVATSGAYNDEWQSRGILNLATNGKIGWATFDLGKVNHFLADFYIWNSRQASGGNIDIMDINLYIAAAPTVTPPQPAPTGNGEVQDYDFSSGGWVQVNTNGVFTVPLSGSGPPDFVTAILDGKQSARYVGIEILSNYGNPSNVGIAEVALTKYPPPAGTVITLK